MEIELGERRFADEARREKRYDSRQKRVGDGDVEDQMGGRWIKSEGIATDLSSSIGRRIPCQIAAALSVGRTPPAAFTKSSSRNSCSSRFRASLTAG